MSFDESSFLFDGTWYEATHERALPDGTEVLSVWEAMHLLTLLSRQESWTLRSLYSDITAHFAIYRLSDEELLANLERELSMLGGLRIVRYPDFPLSVKGQYAARHEVLSPGVQAVRQLDALLGALGRGELQHRGRAYRIARVAEQERVPERRQLEALHRMEARKVLEEMAQDPQRPPKQRETLEKLQRAFENGVGKRDLELVFLRRMRVVVVPAEQGAPVTPSQLRQLRDLHWLEVELVDKRRGPLGGVAFALTLPDGARRRETTNAEGVLRIEHSRPGRCSIQLPATGDRPPKSADSTWSKLELGVSANTGARHRFEVERNEAEILEVDDDLFFHGTSVLLPAARTLSKERTLWGHSGLSIVAHALRYAQERAGRKLMIVGHADEREGDRAALSRARAKVLDALLSGSAEDFAGACLDPEQVATPTLLAWAHDRHGYDCDPEAPPPEDAATQAEDESGGSEVEPVQAALIRFRQQYNQRERAQLDEHVEGMAPLDYQAFFALYERSIADMLEMEPAELASARGKLAYHSVRLLAAQSPWPAPTSGGSKLRSASSRRVDLMFLEGDRPIPTLDATALQAEHFFVDERRVRRTYVAPEPPPSVVCVRMMGMYFDTNKCFLLPSAMAGMRKLVQLYSEHPQGELLIVGHTDRSGDRANNDKLSLERAKAVAAYLSDDSDAWLAWYDKALSAHTRWGKTEDQLMLGALSDAADLKSAKNPLERYQETRGLTVDGIAGPKTRKQLIQDYMALDGTSLPAGLTPIAHGCGEHFPRFGLKEGTSDPRDRRVEMFLFEQGVKPKPAGENSAAGSGEYLRWLGRTVRQVKLHRLGPDLVVVMRVSKNSADTPFALVAGAARVTRRTQGTPLVSDDPLHSLRSYRFEGVAPGTYHLKALVGLHGYTVIRDIEVSLDGVSIGGKPTEQGSDEDGSEEGVQLASHQESDATQATT